MRPRPKLRLVHSAPPRRPRRLLWRAAALGLFALWTAAPPIGFALYLAA